MLEDRAKFELKEYERVLSTPISVDEEGSANVETKHVNEGDFIFTGIKNHIRQYKKI